MTHLYLFLCWFDDFSLDAGHYKWFITDILDPLFLSKSNICSDGSLGWLGSNIKLYLPCRGQQLKWLLNSVSSCCISCLEILGRLLCMWGLTVNPGLRWILPAGLSPWAPPFKHSPPNFLTVLHPQFLSSDTSRQWAGGSLRALNPNHSEQLLKKQRLPPGKRAMRPPRAPPLHSEKAQNHEAEAREHTLRGPQHGPSPWTRCSSFSKSIRTRNSHSGRINFHAPHSSLLIHSGHWG